MNTIATTYTVDGLFGAYRSHVLGRLLPEPTSVHVTPGTREISVQPGGNLDLCSRLGSILVWAFTLADVTASWWHTPDGSLHISVHGRTTGGVRVKVYGGGSFAESLDLVSLDAGESEGVSLDELYALACLLRDGQHEREVA